jgi:DHA1 family tetracycline resistance protein-like MFS transporter
MTPSTFDLRPLMVANMACSMSMMAFVSLIGPIARVLGLATWQAGAAVTVSGVIWMLLARPWGQASDRYGRRRILLIATAGFTLAYWALCLFIDASLRFLPSALLGFIGLMIGRGLIGVFYAAIPVGGNALIADNIEPQHRAKAMAALGAANACGLVIGPAIAALLSRFSLSLPFYAMAILPLLAFLVLRFKLKGQELHLRQAPRKVHLNDPRLRRPMAVAFVAMLCVSIAQITVGFFALDRLGMSPADAAQTAGIALTMVGFALICSQLVVRRLEWPPLQLIRAGALVASVGFAGSILANTAWGLWLCFFVSAGGRDGADFSVIRRVGGERRGRLGARRDRWLHRRCARLWRGHRAIGSHIDLRPGPAPALSGGRFATAAGGPVAKTPGSAEPYRIR